MNIQPTPFKIILDSEMIVVALRALELSAQDDPAALDMAARLGDLAEQGVRDDGSFYDPEMEESHFVIHPGEIDVLIESIENQMPTLMVEFENEIQEEGEQPAPVSLLFCLLDGWSEDDPATWRY